jgi:hypothetical protein
VSIIGFNDAFRRSYVEVVEVLSEAKRLAMSDTGAVEAECQSGVQREGADPAGSGPIEEGR